MNVPDAFRLSAAASFYGGFVPMGGAAAVDGEQLSLAFLADGSFTPVVARLTQRGRELTVESEVDVLAQLRRMLGLDADADAWLAVGQRDPTVGALQREFAGFFTAAFPSPYEAGVGGIIAQRRSMAQARAMRARLSDAYGTRIGGLRVLPSPARLLEVGDGFPKVPALHAVARAALDGRLDAERLRRMPEDAALAELEALPGVGPWTAAHILYRGAASQDGLPTAEPRVITAIRELYGDADVTAVTERWRPFRMWVSVLAVRHLAAVGKF